MRLALAITAILSFASLPSNASEAGDCADRAEHADDLRDAGHLREALSSYEKCATDSCPRVVREDCQKQLFELRRSIPRLTVRVQDALGRDVVDASLTVDGELLSIASATSGVALDPGAHIVKAARGHEQTQSSVLTARGDPVRSVVLVLPVAAPESPPSPKRDRTAAFVVGAVGLTLLGGFAVFGAWSLSDYNRLRDSCGAGCASEVDAARVRGAVADIFLGAGLVTLAVSTVLFFVAPRR